MWAAPLVFGAIPKSRQIAPELQFGERIRARDPRCKLTCCSKRMEKDIRLFQQRRTDGFCGQQKSGAPVAAERGRHGTDI